MSIDSGEANQLQRALAQSIREHWVLFLIEGIVLVVLGLRAPVSKSKTYDDRNEWWCKQFNNYSFLPASSAATCAA